MSGTLAAGGCLSELEAVTLVEAGDVDARAPLVAAHLDACATCRRVVSALAIVRDMELEHERPPRRVLRAGARIGRYVLERPIGEGGMSVVWQAHDEHLGRSVALKWLHPILSADRARACSRVLREARAAARVNHRHVVTIFDSGEHDGDPFIALELGPRGTLRDWLAEAPRTTGQIAGAFADAGRGLAAAHAAGVVHGDFKPENVLACEDGGGNPAFKVTDFGLSNVDTGGALSVQGAAAPHASSTLAGGTPFYMAPERLAGGPPSALADQYAFGVALGAALGERGRSAAAPVARIITRATAASAADRFATMDDLLASLDRVANPRSGRWRLVLAFAVFATIAVGVGWTARALGIEKFTYSTELENGGVEEGKTTPARWTLSGDARDAFDLVRDPSTAHGGRTSARLRPQAARSPGYGTAMQVVYARDFRGKRIRVAAWVRSTGASERADFWIRARFDTREVDGPELGASAAAIDPDSGGEFRRYELTLDVPLRTRVLDVGFGIEGPGTIWFDDVSVEIVQP